MGQILPDDILYQVAGHLDVSSAMNLARTSSSLLHVVTPVVIHADLETDASSLFSAIDRNDLILLKHVIACPIFDINKPYFCKKQSDIEEPGSMSPTVILRYAVQHGSVDAFKILTDTRSYKNLGRTLPDLDSWWLWYTHHDKPSSVLLEAIRYGRSDLIPYIVEELGVRKCPSDWPLWVEKEGSRAYWDIWHQQLRLGMAGGHCATDPDTIQLVAYYGSLGMLDMAGAIPDRELRSKIPEAPYHFLRTAVGPNFIDEPRRWRASPLCMALLQRQHLDSRAYVTLDSIMAWIEAGIDVNDADTGLFNDSHPNPQVSYIRQPIDYTAEALDLDAMSLLLQSGATTNILTIDNASHIAADRYTDVTTMSLLIGHRLWPQLKEELYLRPFNNERYTLGRGAIHQDLWAHAHRLWTELRTRAPAVKALVPAIEEQISLGIRLLMRAAGGSNLPKVVETSSNLPVEVFSFLHDEFLASSGIADLLCEALGRDWINTPDWQKRTPLLQILSRIAPVSETKTWPHGVDRRWYMRQTFRKPELVHWLLENDADPNVEDIDGQTPLDYATFWLDGEIVEMLLQHGAKPKSELLSFIAQYDFKTVDIENPVLVMTYMLTLWSNGCRPGFVTRMKQMQREWYANRAGIISLQDPRDNSFSMELRSSPRDSGLGVFLGTTLSLGESMSTAAHEEKLLDEVDQLRKRAFFEGFVRIQTALRKYLP